ncbi:hypothetical protein [Micropruina sp.]|uniref:hypothetical protein n=1 Tax=Micropruina sp. TaxID=2737536 RepID=UPI0039E2A49D
MGYAVFPDNTVLCNFAAVYRLDLLRDWLRGRGRWCEAVAHEASNSACVLPQLATIAADGWLGDPIEISDREAVSVERIRRVVMGGHSAKPLQHLGEAQTCHVIRTVAEFADSWWVSDDHDAVEYAKRQGILTYRTVDVMRMIVADGDLDAEQALALMRSMQAAGRSLFVPDIARELG